MALYSNKSVTNRTRGGRLIRPPECSPIPIPGRGGSVRVAPLLLLVTIWDFDTLTIRT